jgi:putative ABC transport system substrate-binding protein
MRQTIHLRGVPSWVGFRHLVAQAEHVNLRPAALILIIAAAFLALPLVTKGQPPAGKVWRVGVLLALYPSHADPPQAFRQRLREFGYIEGQNVVIEWRDAQQKSDQLPSLAAELIRLKVDLIVADVTVATRAVMQAAPTVPIVMALAADPVGDRLVSSLARPGGNVTGIALMHPEVSAKRLQLFREVMTKGSRVAVLWHPPTPWHNAMLKAVEAAAPSLGLQVVPMAVQRPAEFDGMFAAMAKERVDAVFVADNPFFLAHRTRLLDLATKSRLPTMFGNRDYVLAGGLMSYGVDYAGLFRQAAGHVDKILKGAKPADLAIEQPTKFELVVNLKTARALGLTISPSVLARADEVIQ